MKNKKKKFKISGKLILNTAVTAITIYLIIYFFASEDGLIDLLSRHGSFSIGWLIIALIVYDLNILADTLATLILIRIQYKTFRFIDALKVSFVGVFFGAVTPSSTGGQPMQLYLLSKQNVSPGFGTSCLTQKFIVYQILNTVISIVAVLIDFKYFKSAFTGIWSTLFIALGFASQLLVTALFLTLAFSKKLTDFLLKIVHKLIIKIKIIKNPDQIMQRIYDELRIFRSGNNALPKYKKKILAVYCLVFLQIIAILSVPYFIYLSFGMPEISAETGAETLNIFEIICIQSFVMFTSNLIPLPGASGGAELAFGMYFRPFFNIGGHNTIKSAILLWRFVTYYGAIIISAPFSYFTSGKKSEKALTEEQGVKSDDSA